jgi:hypothetical protein
MTPTRRHLAALVFCCAACSAPAQTLAQTPTQPLPSPDPTPIAGLGNISVASMRIADLTPDGVVIAVDLSLTPARTVALDSIWLSGLSVNSLPIHADPIDRLIQLPKGKPAPLPQLTVKVFFRDLTTVAPLRQMVDSQMVHVQGQANATLHATFLEKLALGAAHPVVAIPFSQDVPIALPDSPYAKQAADTILTFVQAGLDAGVAGKATLLDPDWIKTLRSQASSALFRVETRYTLEQSQKPYPISVNLLAFQLAAGPILTTPEARTPWEYEPDFLARIQSGEARLAPDSTEVQLYPVSLTGAPPARDATLLLTRKDFTLREQGTPTRTKTIVDAKSIASVEVRNRVDPANLLSIAPQSPTAPGWPTQGLPLAAAPPPSQTAWPKLAVFRLIPKTPGSAASIELVQLSAHRDGSLLRFDQPLDPAAFGSPVVSPEGVVAIVQDETTAALLPANLKTPK